MKRILIVLVLSLLTTITNAQQQDIPNEFFGLRLGEAYTVEQLIAAIGDNGTYISNYGSNDTELGYLNNSFQDVTYKGKTYSLAFFATLKDGTLISVSFYLLPNAGRTLESAYDEIKNELSQRYEMLPQESRPGVERVGSQNNDTMLLLEKCMEDGQCSYVSIYYTSLTAVNDYYLQQNPAIQDSFFGMKMGSSYSSRQFVINKIGNKGTFLSEDYTSNGKTITFGDVSFAGSTWDFASLSFTENGAFYDIDLSSNYNDGYLYKDDENEAQSKYEYFKEKLNDKYGVQEESISDEGRYVVYFGCNNMRLILSNRRAKSRGGDYRRYVSLNYTQTEINSQQNAKSDDDL